MTFPLEAELSLNLLAREAESYNRSQLTEAMLFYARQAAVKEAILRKQAQRLLTWHDATATYPDEARRVLVEISNGRCKSWEFGRYVSGRWEHAAMGVRFDQYGCRVLRWCYAEP